MGLLTGLEVLSHNKANIESRLGAKDCAQALSALLALLAEAAHIVISGLLAVADEEDVGLGGGGGGLGNDQSAGEEE